MAKRRDDKTSHLQIAPALRLQLLQRAKEFRQAPTATENRLWQALRGQRVGVKFRRQQPIGPFIADFFCAEAALIVEVDGAVHAAQRDRDAARDDLLRACGYHVLRIPAEQVNADLPGVLDRIRGCLGVLLTP